MPQRWIRCFYVPLFCMRCDIGLVFSFELLRNLFESDMQKFQCKENLPVSDAALVLVFVKESYLGVLEFGLYENASTPSLYSSKLNSSCSLCVFVPLFFQVVFT